MGRHGQLANIENKTQTSCAYVKDVRCIDTGREQDCNGIGSSRNVRHVH